MDDDIFKEYETRKSKKDIPSNQIFLIDNFISKKDCETIIKVIKLFSSEKELWGDKQNVQANYINSDQIKNDKVRNMIDTMIFNYISKFVNILHNDYGISSTGDSGYCLREIFGATRFHKDGISVSEVDNKYIPIKKIRNMSVIIALNDDYEGGYFHFPTQKTRLRLKKGQLIAFPPYWTHLHGVEAPLNGTKRYTINTWLFE